MAHQPQEHRGWLKRIVDETWGDFFNIVAPASPAAGRVRLYAEGDCLKFKKSSGTVINLCTGGATPGPGDCCVNPIGTAGNERRSGLITIDANGGKFQVFGDTDFPNDSYNTRTFNVPDSVFKMPYVVYKGASTADGYAQFAGRYNWRTLTNLYVGILARFNPITSTRLWLGVTSLDSVNFQTEDNVIKLYVQDAAMFRYSVSAGDANWKCIVQAGNSGGLDPAIADSGVAPDTNPHKYEIIFDDKSSPKKVIFKIDHTVVATVNPPRAYDTFALNQWISTTRTISGTQPEFDFAFWYLEADTA